MPAAMLTPDKPPPEGYYQNNCREGFEFVLARYHDLLDAHTSTSLLAYLDASTDAQRLFARLLTRKALVREDALNYAEVKDRPAALDELAKIGLVTVCPQVPADQLLHLLTKAELLALPQPFHANITRSMKKDDLVSQWLSRYSDQQIHRRMVKEMRWVALKFPAVWRLVRLLYFGDSQQDWSAFVIRDLGMVSYEPVDMGCRHHKSVTELQADLALRQLSGLSYRLDEHPDLAEHLALLVGQAVQDEDRRRATRRARTLLRLGQWLERHHPGDRALAVYRHVERHPARERIVRMLHKLERFDDSQAWLNTMKATPLCEEEAQFVERFGKRQAGFQPAVTTVDIEHAEKEIEQQALALVLDTHALELDAQDSAEAWGAHVENSLLRSLTGLMYWPIIFADIPGAFTNPFQFGPHDLYSEDFVPLRSRQLAAWEEKLSNDAALESHLLAVVKSKQGVANALVNWSMFAAIPIEKILAAMPLSDIRALCGFQIRHLQTRRAGLPDLFVAYGPKRYELIEVKGPSDQLQPGQRLWFKTFNQLGIPARVLKLRLAK